MVKPIDDNSPRGVVVAGLSGGSGKSVVAVGLAGSLARQGLRVTPLKKGPDYIDAGWLGLAAGQPCCNLDPYLLSHEMILESFYQRSCSADYVIIEGNRGVFDGVDLEGSFSTAELSVALKLPVILVVDCTKSTRTMAALVAGCQRFDRRVEFRGVVLNRVGGGRHESMVRRSIEHYTGITVLGAMPRHSEDVFPQRHLGLTPGPEHRQAGRAVAILADRVEKHLDIEKIKRTMAPIHCPKEWGARPRMIARAGSSRKKVKIGVIRDSAFQFYYPENLEALETAGAELLELNALKDPRLPDLDGLYIGGGFPETSAVELAANRSFMDDIKRQVELGLPVYAECGGLIYLGRSMTVNGKEFELTGIFPVSFVLERRPQAHGYTDLVVSEENPFYPVGTEISGHEFRYSRIVGWQGDSSGLALRMDRGVGFAEGRDGLVHKNVLALYTHIHALGTPEWAAGMVEAALEFKKTVG